MYQKCDKRQVLVETDQIKIQGNEYLNKSQKYGKSGYLILYVDKT